jgi:hypothetical protein
MDFPRLHKMLECYSEAFKNTVCIKRKRLEGVSRGTGVPAALVCASIYPNPGGADRRKELKPPSAESKELLRRKIHSGAILKQKHLADVGSNFKAVASPSLESK